VSATVIERRRARLRAALAESELDALLVTRLVNVRYLTGFTGSNATLLVTADGGGGTFVTDGRYAEQAAAEVADLGHGLELVIDRTWEWLPGRAAGRPRLGVESHALPWDTARMLGERLGADRIVPAGALIERLRQAKDDTEIDAVERACRLTTAAFDALLGWLAPAMSERAVAERLGQDLRERGADDTAFETIVASGANGARPHHRPGRRLLAAGDLVTVDFGARVDGYCADMTRTVALGSPPAELARIHDIVRHAQRRGVERVRDGVGAAEVDHACRSAITDAGHGERFVHPTGHALGLEIHEQPILHQEATATLRRRMTVTVEPGIYLPGLGGVRIEDVVLVTDRAGRVLTTAPVDLVQL
jgi:Xaa-Pro aminopeptidase